VKLRALQTCLALCLACLAGHGMAQSAPLPVCPVATELPVQRLYGLWRAEFIETGSQRATANATVLFERHPAFAQGVRGAIAHGQGRALLSGDADEGVFTLDESVDGINISATWTGNIVPHACGKEIRGTWTDITRQRTLDFVLRKLPD